MIYGQHNESDTILDACFQLEEHSQAMHSAQLAGFSSVGPHPWPGTNQG